MREQRAYGLPLWGILFVLCCVGVSLLGCSVTMQQAQTAHRAGQTAQALQMYREVATRTTSAESLNAQLAIVELLAHKEQWQEILGESSRLTSFFDVEDTWCRRYQSDPKIWLPARHAVERVLLGAARKALVKARQHGDPTTYVAMGHLYGLYLEHYPKGTKRAEAAIGRGYTLALRGQCKEALRWFEKTHAWADASKQTKSEEERRIRQEASKGTLGCRIKLWLAQQNEKPTTKKEVVEKARKKKEGFEQLKRLTRRILEELGERDPMPVLRAAINLQRDNHYAEALALNLIFVRIVRRHPARALAKANALQLFGRTSRWELMLPQLREYLKIAKSGKTDTRFTHRLKTLVVLHGLRQARPLLRQKNYKAAAQRYLAIHSLAPRHAGALSGLYELAQALEKGKKYDEAAQLYKRMFEGQDKHPLTTRALYRYAITLYKLKKPGKSANWFYRLSNEHRKSPIASRAMYMSYLLNKRIRRFRRARRLRRLLRRRFPRSMELVCVFNRKARMTAHCQSIE